MNPYTDAPVRPANDTAFAVVHLLVAAAAATAFDDANRLNALCRTGTCRIVYLAILVVNIVGDRQHWLYL